MKEEEFKEIYQTNQTSEDVQQPDLPDMISMHRFRLYIAPGRDSKDSDWNPRGDGGKLGVKMLSEKWTWIQIPSAA